MLRSRLGRCAGLLLVLLPPCRSHAQTADSTTTSAAIASATGGFDATQDARTIAAADSLGVSGSQRQIFFNNVQAVVQSAQVSFPEGGRPVVDSALKLVVVETGRKLRFVRHARVLFSDMYARRAKDEDRLRLTEEELWRSPRNVSGLIALFRKDPDPSDFEIERAMAPSFRVPR